jgi:hypothetical protein
MSLKKSLKPKLRISEGGPKMRYLRFTTLLGICMLGASYANAQRVIVGVGVGLGYGYVGPAPVCAYGYMENTLTLARRTDTTVRIGLLEECSSARARGFMASTDLIGSTGQDSTDQATTGLASQVAGSMGVPPTATMVAAPLDRDFPAADSMGVTREAVLKAASMEAGIDNLTGRGLSPSGDR